MSREEHLESALGLVLQKAVALKQLRANRQAILERGGNPIHTFGTPALLAHECSMAGAAQAVLDALKMPREKPLTVEEYRQRRAS